jgi:A/G-specific adenine glycosylase
MTTPARVAATPRRGSMGRALLAWYDRRRRDLPWRREPSPYRTLVSEFMLQQTVVATAIPYFERFVARLPDLQALAGASQNEILALWSGLGYYARARNLHRAARAVVDLHGGELPADEAALRGLPGIGPYTAAAIAAIAFGRRTLPLDGNVARVIARLSGIVDAIDQPAVQKRLRAIGQPWVPTRRPGDFAQAMMELGATVCVSRTPRCGECPLVATCVASRRGLIARIPTKTARAPKRVVHLAAIRLRRRGEVLLIRRQTGLLAGTWMLPARAVGPGESDPDAARALLREISQIGKEGSKEVGKEVKKMGALAGRLTFAGRVRHLFTHRDVRVAVFDARPPKPPCGPIDGADQMWADELRLDELAVSSLLHKQLKLQRDKPQKQA